jgi:hypothetical protein
MLVCKVSRDCSKACVGLGNQRIMDDDSYAGNGLEIDEQEASVATNVILLFV